MEDVLVISMTIQSDCSSINTSKPFLLEFIFLTSRVYCIDFMLLTGVTISNITSAEGRLANIKGGVIGQCPEFV